MNDFTDVSMAKAELRQRMKNMRSALQPPEDSEAGGRIVRRILEVPELWSHEAPLQSPVIGLYSPIRMEADLISHAGFFREKGLRIALPRICGDTLVFSEVHAEVKDNKELRAGVFGILEPLPDAVPVAREDLYIICVPGLAFDACGGRLGYGRGYYDQYLQTSAGGRSPVLIGVGYDFQLLDSVPMEPHDKRLDYIITPSCTLKCDNI